MLFDEKGFYRARIMLKHYSKMGKGFLFGDIRV
jgi:hypothetical protein